MQKTTQHIGQLSNKILVFGGVYSNFQALEQLMNIAKIENIPTSNIICTGDIVGYCAEPERCLQAIKNWKIHTILGNVEIQLRDDADDCGCNFNDNSRCDILSKQWFPYAQRTVSEESKKWLTTIPDHLIFEFGGKRCLVVHGNYFETSGYVFRSTDWQIKQQNFDTADVEVIFGGHCGLPFSDIQHDKYWLNAGVIGMPANDGTTKVWYMIVEENPFQVKHHSFEYDYQTAHNLMNENCLPRAYAETLTTGIWDNCDILPDVETLEQGKNLIFE